MGKKHRLQTQFKGNKPENSLKDSVYIYINAPCLSKIFIKKLRQLLILECYKHKNATCFPSQFSQELFQVIYTTEHP